MRVELRLSADVGMVGAPNAGKSSLLRSLTASCARVGNFAFTTTHPHLGVIDEYDRAVVLADMPGIIEGAASGAGLGLRFLRHISRSSAIAIVVSLLDGDPIATYQSLIDEMERYDSELLQKPRLVLLSKYDDDSSSAILRKARHALSHETTIAFSNYTRRGLDEVKNAIVAIAKAAR